MTRIKFCGLKTLDDIQAANQLLPEYIGFVFAPKSKRYVAPAQARQLRNALDKQPSPNFLTTAQSTRRNFTATKRTLTLKICAG